MEADLEDLSCSPLADAYGIQETKGQLPFCVNRVRFGVGQA